MALNAAHFTEPAGELAPHLFPLTAAERTAGTTEAAKLAGLLGTWIAQAEAAIPGTLIGAARDVAAEAYVYWRAKRSVFLRLSSNAADVTAEGEGRRVYSKDQIATFGTEAAAHQRAYEAAIEVPASPAPARRARPVSGTIRNTPHWG